MGSKNNPGKFDCYEKAHPDEPLFVLRAKDPTAAQVVRYWVHMNLGVQSEEKIEEAERCVIAMEDWEDPQP